MSFNEAVTGNVIVHPVGPVVGLPPTGASLPIEGIEDGPIPVNE
jgi:hypothetical protein